MTPPQAPRDEVPLDEHLRAALRHAPDHGLSAPARLSQAILAAAAQVHRPALAAPAPEPMAPRVVPERQVSWREAMQSLLAPRWAGSIAAGLVAALVVGLWYGEEVPAPVHDERVATVHTPAAPAVSPPDRAPAAGGASPGAESQASAEPASSVAPSPPAPAAVAPPMPAPAAAPPAAARKAEGQVAERRAELGKVESERPPPLAPASPALVSPSPPSAPPAAAALRRAPSAADAPTADAGSRSGETARSLVPQGPAAASPALTLLRRVSADSENRSAIWTWQPEAAATARSFDTDGTAWLQRLVYAARGRWVDVAERSEGTSATEVRWWRNDEPVALLRIEAHGLRWIEPTQRIRFAPMSAEELTRLAPPR